MIKDGAHGKMRLGIYEPIANNGETESLSMSVQIKPKALQGGWKQGFALDVHTTSSTFVGHNEYGRPEFATTRSPLGELLYRLKYQRDPSVIEEIVNTVAGFIKTSEIGIDALVPMPPSNVRSVQPVLQIANALGKKLGVPVLENCVSKTKKTPQLKDVYNYEERTKLLEGAFTVNRDQCAGKSLLLFDDLYRSGATMNAVAQELTKTGSAKEVFVLALTHTRSSL
jgi:competence protein ComFC